MLKQHAVLQKFQSLVTDLSLTATGSANRVTRLMLMAEPPSIDLGEVTDKGSINQRAVLKARDDLVQALYDETAGHIVIKPGTNLGPATPPRPSTSVACAPAKWRWRAP